MNPIKRDFTFPPFYRKMWVSDQARQVCEPKCTQYAEYWRQIEWLSVVEQIRPCALVLVSQQELAGLASVLADYRLKVIPLSGRPGDEGKRKVLLFRAVIGRFGDLRKFSKAWKAGNDDEIGRLLGYPPCCRAFFHELFVTRTLMDFIWQMGVQTARAEPSSQRIEITGLPELNPFWLGAGVRMVPHYPCRFDCPSSHALAQQFVVAARKTGYGNMVDNALEMLSWPVEWSCLHGIAEIRTPIVKISQRTDPTAAKHSLNLAGTAYPKEGAKGLLPLFRLSRNPSKEVTPFRYQEIPVENFAV